MLRVHNALLEKKLKWDNIYHESLWRVDDSSMTCRYEWKFKKISAKEICYLQKKRMASEASFQFLWNNSLFFNLWNTLYDFNVLFRITFTQIFSNSTYSKSTFDKHLFCHISILQAYFELTLHTSVSISKPTTMVIILWKFLMFYEISLSP